MKSMLFFAMLALAAGQVYPYDSYPATAPGNPPADPMVNPNNVAAYNNGAYPSNTYTTYNNYNNGPLNNGPLGGSPLGGNSLPVFSFPDLFNKNDNKHNNQPVARNVLSLLQGSYAFATEGDVLSRGEATLGSLVAAGEQVPVSLAGLACFDGWGGCTINMEANIGGLIEIGVNNVRLFTPPGNCTYTMNLNGTGIVNATFFADTGSPVPDEVLQLGPNTLISVIVINSEEFFFTLHGPLVLAGEGHKQIDDFVTPYSTMAYSVQRKTCPILVFNVRAEGQLCGLGRPSCPYGQYCSASNSCGFTTGVCRRRPSWCDPNANVTCCACAGSLTKQFRSECWANYHGWEKAWDGVCR